MLLGAPVAYLPKVRISQIERSWARWASRDLDTLGGLISHLDNLGGEMGGQFVLS